jgi:hypothetical protein
VVMLFDRSIYDGITGNRNVFTVTWDISDGRAIMRVTDNS